MMSNNRAYYGWIVIEQEEGYKDHIYAEYNDEEGAPRKREFMGYGNSGCAKAVEWWDSKLKQHISLQPMGKIGYRVYVESASQENMNATQ